jgi:hypothetical protein
MIKAQVKALRLPVSLALLCVLAPLREIVLYRIL